MMNAFSVGNMPTPPVGPPVSVVDIFFPGFSAVNASAQQLLLGDADGYVRLLSHVIHVYYYDEAYEMVIAWIYRQPFAKEADSLMVRVKTPDVVQDQSLRKKPLSYSPWDGSFGFWYKSHRLTLHCHKREHHEEISISSIGTSPKILMDLLGECREQYLKLIQRKVPVFQPEGGEWKRTGLRHARDISTVLMDEAVKKDVLEDMRQFLDEQTQDWYTARGIPYKRGYLLDGPPGTGKSSFCLSVAGLYELDIYMLNLSSLGDSGLAKLFTQLPPRCVVLLEDVDAVGLDRKDSKDTGTGQTQKDAPQRGVSLSGLLNVIDGVGSQEGRILIMSTNYIDHLDEALIRPGRVDKTILFKCADKKIVTQLFCTIFKQTPAGYEQPPKETEDLAIERLAEEFAAHVPQEEFSPAKVLSFLLEHKDSPADADNSQSSETMKRACDRSFFYKLRLSYTNLIWVVLYRPHSSASFHGSRAATKVSRPLAHLWTTRSPTVFQARRHSSHYQNLMADNSSPDYKALFLKAEADRRQEAELRRQAEDRERHEAELRRQAEDRERDEAELRKQAETNTQPTTFKVFVQACHDLLSRPLKVGTPTKSTKGKIPPPTGKYCPTRLRYWSDCPIQQQEIYDSVYTFLQPLGKDAPQLFAPLAELHGLNRRFSRRELRSEKDLESYERFAVEDHVHDIIAELCKIPAAREKFQLGDGIIFDNHSNTLDEPEGDDDDLETSDVSRTHYSRPDQFCIHRVDGTTNELRTTVEYKPPHKFREEDMRSGLRPMEFWKDVVNQDKIPTDRNKKLKYNAEQLTGSVLAQEYHIMIQEGLEYSYITNGLAFILLRVPYDDPSTLDYCLCEPNLDINIEHHDALLQPKTAICRVLCLCLMSFRSPVRSQAWRHAAKSQLHTWKTSFDHTRSQIPDEELQQNPPDSEYTSSEYTGSEYLPSSPLSPTKAEQSRRTSTRFQGDCAPTAHDGHLDSSESESGQATQGRKRGFSQIMSSPSQHSSKSPTRSTPHSSGGRYRHTAPYCTQRCLLGLQQRGVLDDFCPNIDLHRQGQDDGRHRIDGNQLAQLLKEQLGRDLDHNCTPIGACGTCGSSGAPFKITSAEYGYTVVGKGTTSRRWKKVSREVEIYRILRKAQGSAVPVFIGAIDLKRSYFLHGAGEIKHMLLMSWGGQMIGLKESALPHEISRSMRQIRKLGVVHEDLRNENMLWNDELGRVFIIDFHQSRIDCRPTRERVRSLKRPLNIQTDRSKRPRLLYT
uniref:Putative mitochondrial chaperone BCS1-B n=1 Tax=Talaromyces marneffei PM1 TaxID=1077442 RepID=A0A093UQK4_TALMA